MSTAGPAWPLLENGLWLAAELGRRLPGHDPGLLHLTDAALVVVLAGSTRHATATVTRLRT
ncbi:hypothetical protein ACWIG4_27370 [Streptomyces sp. NPDC002248]